ncbi:MAG: HEPN domain-containing protein [Methanoculleus marisnigri]|uniref:HEPN domain protein n=3 Tax=Methanoculleus TaxID=45989 RepID=A3CRV6_METMJ|nr:HEPN domain-containing protein [Methanoculleus marisnigri]ABN56106.1 HEPN domain protein [Methanoculleus marisnigri JR1]MCC7556360.1 HEPN domain-containing protein [Methanoculleus marisnigri]MDN7011907.1 HEPN domain-containing protein [Methanoculleus sp. FWC-SCC3]
MDANMREAGRWLRQGERDLVSARNSCRSGDFEWACFQAQQSAEKTLKALLYARGYRRILTHSVYELIREIGEYEPSFLALKSEAKALDAAYITTRYPDSIVGNLTPSEYYDQEDAEECIEHADSICSAAREALAG